ncbi:hypothetical protein GPY51_23230 [Photorhabdus laumondii subsp. laumondii]|uniref:Photorhabdus luminescens subsp. laumondii TTO1 complete genome segment 2/17 n=3 Tax=Photorhabdus TaxID=29487 RepID=Q7N9I2_PHOLL|nr:MULTISPECIES: hypothetical protein [Photorhabdus]AWK40324.1 hypothetical protein A4R40_01710 [Photorhabdus laumondii subsp. laumondii]AXG45665.1 hypothetical protein PluTT01m_01785 [Photorhabdus laumondii subsp. laumondii]KTL62254.1 hypothetical protein AA106_21040 [Photorhabdus laumondii subsp. laumondii]NDK97216.1 hypothetical protein [Photorhabdus laumondii subsp. laumondii]NDL23286.1 hypothetical protein [Photorhabdus laumondii subsp. laumondii]
MGETISFHMEPVEFFKSSYFLSGSIGEFNEYEIIDNKDMALKLLFDQDIPCNYMVWSDFFSDLVSEFYLHEDYKKAEKDILDRIKISTQDQVKENIRKRKLYLTRKKQGLVDNIEYDNFLNEVNDECNYMLNMISIYRYLFSFNQDSKLEEIFSIFKKGVMPCGIKKDKKTLVIFNPILLKNS